LGLPILIWVFSKLSYR